MNIGLIDVDSHNFPNLPLMKISAYHKNRSDNVEMWNGLKHYDKVYVSKVFDESYTEDMEFCINADEVVYGGTGYDLVNKLPYEIEHQYPDYSLYPLFTKDNSYGFISRGCPRQCSFCNVSEQQGKVAKVVADLSEFWTNEKNIILLDPNITALKECEKIFNQLIQTDSFIEFNQGLDIRYMDQYRAAQLNTMKIKMIHFAWDNYEMKTYEKLKQIRPFLKGDGRNLRVYVLTNFNTTHEQDLERIYKLKELKYDPYVMVFDKKNSPKQTRNMQRWVNNKFIWRSCDRFEDYKTGVTR